MEPENKRHYTQSDKIKIAKKNRARLAQSVARRSHNPKVVSSILAPRIFETATLKLERI